MTPAVVGSKSVAANAGAAAGVSAGGGASSHPDRAAAPSRARRQARRKEVNRRTMSLSRARVGAAGRMYTRRHAGARGNRASWDRGRQLTGRESNPLDALFKRPTGFEGRGGIPIRIHVLTRQSTEPPIGGNDEKRRAAA